MCTECLWKSNSCTSTSWHLVLLVIGPLGLLVFLALQSSEMFSVLVLRLRGTGSTYFCWTLILPVNVFRISAEGLPELVKIRSMSLVSAILMALLKHPGERSSFSLRRVTPALMLSLFTSEMRLTSSGTTFRI